MCNLLVFSGLLMLLVGLWQTLVWGAERHIIRSRPSRPAGSLFSWQMFRTSQGLVMSCVKRWLMRCSCGLGVQNPSVLHRHGPLYWLFRCSRLINGRRPVKNAKTNGRQHSLEDKTVPHWTESHDLQSVHYFSHCKQEVSFAWQRIILREMRCLVILLKIYEPYPWISSLLEI